MRTVADEVQDLGKRMGFAAWQTSGYESAKWILVDCVNVVVHVFDSDSRDFYDLELLWGDCPRIDWRKELGLPPAPEGEERLRVSDRFAESSGMDEMEAEEEDARLEGRNLDDEEEGDADVDEDAEVDSPVVMEIPDESTGSNSVEFVEIDPPAKRRKRGRSVYPTPIGDVDEDPADTIGGRPISAMAGADESRDEDDQERAAEARADEDVEAVSEEDLPQDRIASRPMGGVNAGMSRTTIADDEEEDQQEAPDLEDAEQDHREDVTEMYEAAAETTSFAKPEDDQTGIDVSAEMASELPPGGRVLRNRKGEKAPTQSAPGPVKVERARAGVVKAKTRGRGVERGRTKSPKPVRSKKPVKTMAKKSVKTGAARGNTAKAKPAKKTAAAKTVGKKGAASKASSAKKSAGAAKKGAKTTAKKAAPKSKAKKK